MELTDASSEIRLTPDLDGKKNGVKTLNPDISIQEAIHGNTVTDEHLCNVRKLLAGEVNEGQVIEAGGDRGVALDERAAAGVLGEELMNPRIVTQQTTVGSERKAAEITPANTNTEENAA